MDIYASQTQILENETARWACLFDGLCEYSIRATNHRKVPRKDTPNALFRFPKSSCGEHKIVQQKGMSGTRLDDAHVVIVDQEIQNQISHIDW